VGVGNIGKFYAFLWLVEIGTIFVIWCHLCMLGLNKEFIRYRDFTGLEPEEKAFSVVALLLAGFFAFSILMLIIQQTKNIASNTTQFERSRNMKRKLKASQSKASGVA
jgi:hypothetical protein